MSQVGRAFIFVVAIASTGAAAFAAEVTPGGSGATASTSDTNVPANAVDNNLSTRWSGNGDGAWLRLDLGAIHTVEHVTIAVYQGNTRQNRFDLDLSTDGTNWTRVITNKSTSGTTNAEEIHDLTDTPARYVRYTGHGSTAGTWNSVTEISVFATTGPVPTVTPTPAVTVPPTPTPATATPTPTPTTAPGNETNITPGSSAVTASTHDGNVPGNVVDRNLATRWSANGLGQWLRLDLGSTRSVSYVRVAHYSGNARAGIFSIQLSNDGSSWQTVWSGQSSGNTTALEMFDFADNTARYVRYLGNGNTVSQWNSVTEIEVWGTSCTSCPTPTFTPTPAVTVPPTPTPTPVAATPTPTPTPGSATCPLLGSPSGKVLVGYWENWDGAANGVHPGMGWIPLSQVPSGYNVINMAFPVIMSDGTMRWENGMDGPGTRVPSPAEVCAEKARGRRVLISIGGATAGINLESRAVADRFIQTAVAIARANNIDGYDIDIETGLVAGSSWGTLSTSQANLIHIIDGILAQMPSNFMLTSAPETAYVTGGQIAYGGPWGAYLPIIQKYVNNGRLNWLQMQYYNGNMYGCNPPGQSYQAGTVQGFVEQTRCQDAGIRVAGTSVVVRIPFSKLVPGLPAQPGAGGGYMTTGDVRTAYGQVSSIKGLMTWSINWDGSKGYTFMNNARSLF
jgi:chitinase